jgi:hypothetical protein
MLDEHTGVSLPIQPFFDTDATVTIPGNYASVRGVLYGDIFQMPLCQHTPVRLNFFFAP